MVHNQKAVSFAFPAVAPTFQHPAVRHGSFLAMQIRTPEKASLYVFLQSTSKFPLLGVSMWAGHLQDQWRRKNEFHGTLGI